MFITFEGIEGCGKTTQAKRLVSRLRNCGVHAVLTLEPGGTQIGQDIRRILLDFRNQNLSPLAELLLYAAERAQHVEEVIKPALSRGNWIVCDRFFDATTVYQGYARGQDMVLIKTLNKQASCGIRPNTTVLIDCPVEIGLERALARNTVLADPGQDRFEREKKEFHEAVREGYLSLAREEHERFVVVDGTLDEDTLEEKIFEHIKPFIVRDKF